MFTCSDVCMVCVSVFKRGGQRMTWVSYFRCQLVCVFEIGSLTWSLPIYLSGHRVPGICLPFCSNPGITSTLLTELSLKDLNGFWLYVYFRFCLSFPSSILMCHYRHSLSATTILCFLALWILYFYNFLEMESRRFFCLLSFTWHSASRITYAFLWVDSFLLQGSISLTFVWIWKKKIYLCRQKIK